jgi:uncharacterized spore protein YtfJ
MDVQEVLSHARDAMTVKRVFGEAYEKDGVTVIPVASVMGGVGAGGGTGAGVKPEGETQEAAGEDARDSGYGVGYGLRASPAGVYVIKDGEVEWKPALDASRVVVWRAGVVIVALLVFRSIVRTLAKR